MLNKTLLGQNAYGFVKFKNEVWMPVFDTFLYTFNGIFREFVSAVGAREATEIE